MSLQAGAICRVKGLEARKQAGKSRRTLQSRCIEFDGSRVEVDRAEERVGGG